jgi:AcrR family transcriptional regulator
MEDVARAAGVGKGTLYRRFPAREHLFAAILQDRVDELDASARRALDVPDAWRTRGGRWASGWSYMTGARPSTGA